MNPLYDYEFAKSCNECTQLQRLMEYGEGSEYDMVLFGVPAWGSGHKTCAELWVEFPKVRQEFGAVAIWRLHVQQYYSGGLAVADDRPSHRDILVIVRW